MGTEVLYGVENIKKVIGFGLGLSKDIPKALADGKINIKDAPLFLDDALKIPGVISAAAQVKNEYLDLDRNEKEEINQFVADTLDYPDADVEEVIADAFKVAIDASDLVQDIIALAKSIGKLKDA
jgi:hypothetical protein